MIERAPTQLNKLLQQQRYWFTTQTETQYVYQTSVVATINDTSRTERMIGFCHSFPQQPFNDDCVVPSDLVMTPCINMMTQLKSNWLKNWSAEQPRRTILHIQDLAVLSEYSGRGIASDMISMTIDIASKLNYSGIITEASSASQNVFYKCGFQSINSIVYDEYQYQGEKIFSGISSFSTEFPKPAVHLMYRSLQ